MERVDVDDVHEVPPPRRHRARRGGQARAPAPSYPGFIDTNLAELTNVSEIQFEGTSELLLKPIGLDKHVGGQVISPNGPEYASLKELVARLGKPDTCADQPNTTLTNVALMDGPATLRKVALDLAGRLPTAAEVSAVQKGGDSALGTALDGFMTEAAFYDRLREIWNDTLLTDALLYYNGAALDALNDTDYPGVDAFKTGGAMAANGALANTAVAREPLDSSPTPCRTGCRSRTSSRRPTPS